MYQSAQLSCDVGAMSLTGVHHESCLSLCAVASGHSTTVFHVSVHRCTDWETLPIDDSAIP